MFTNFLHTHSWSFCISNSTFASNGGPRFKLQVKQEILLITEIDITHCGTYVQVYSPSEYYSQTLTDVVQSCYKPGEFWYSKYAIKIKKWAELKFSGSRVHLVRAKWIYVFWICKFNSVQRLLPCRVKVWPVVCSWHINVSWPSSTLLPSISVICVQLFVWFRNSYLRMERATSYLLAIYQSFTITLRHISFH
jgi:hypothetical protein